MSQAFLTQDEVQELTGYSRKGDQCRALANMGVKALVNRLGRPIVSREAVTQLLGVISSKQVEAMPDLIALSELD